MHSAGQMTAWWGVQWQAFARLRETKSGVLGRGFKAIGSSDKVHVVDALAITGEEGRGSLRKAPGSWQISIDPEMSEWGNPPARVSPSEYIGG